MAGNYPDVPAPRMAYDRDGTIGFKYIAGAVTPTQLTGGEMAQINNETENTWWSQDTVPDWYYGLLFPQLRDIIGYFNCAYFNTGSNPIVMYTSTDTTNGMDGIWTNRGNLSQQSGVANYRTAISTVSWLGVKGARLHLDFQGGSGVRTIKKLHLYGSIATGETPDRVRMWHPTLDEPLDDTTSADGIYFDWGDIQRNTTSDKTFRIKNNSATLTANSIVISQQTLTDTSPTVNSQFTFSDGGAFAASIDIGNLAPGAISPVITKRFTRPSNATLGLWTSRTIADPTSWT